METFLALLAFCAANSPVTSQMSLTANIVDSSSDAYTRQ